MDYGQAQKKWLITTLLVLIAGLALTPAVNQKATTDYELLFERAFVTFALARTLNGVISAVQGTEVALQPAGVGVTLTPGEILDPVNDLVERFSWIMLGATISLGIQNVLLDVSAWWDITNLASEPARRTQWIIASSSRSVSSRPWDAASTSAILPESYSFIWHPWVLMYSLPFIDSSRPNPTA